MVFDVEPPSVFLPQLNTIRTCSQRDLSNAIARLREIYARPQVRGSTRRRLPWPAQSTCLALTALSPVGVKDQPLSLLSVDSFERSFAIQWLTRFISIGSELTSESQDGAAWDVDLLEQAASILAVCSGAAASGNIERVFTFPFIPSGSSLLRNCGIAAPPQALLRTLALNEGSGPIQTCYVDDIRVVLRDAPLESSDLSSVGAQTWGGSCVLAEMIAEGPANFGIFGDVTPNARIRSSFRALELGAGTGLASLVLAKVLERVRPSTPQVSASGDMESPTSPRHEPDIIFATDFHPSVLANLKDNVGRNFPRNIKEPPVVVLPLDWSLVDESSRSGENYASISAAEPANRDDELSVATKNNKGFSPLLDVPFDLIIGADIIYEPSHARWVRSCIEHFLRKPDPTPIPISSSTHDANDTSEDSSYPALFHLLIPLRQTHRLELRTLEQVFHPVSEVIAMRKAMHHGYLSTDAGDDANTRHPYLFPAPDLAIFSQEDIACAAYTDTEVAEDVIYRYYKIGWV